MGFMTVRPRIVVGAYCKHLKLVYMFTTRPLWRDPVLIYPLAIFNEVIMPIVNDVMLKW